MCPLVLLGVHTGLSFEKSIVDIAGAKPLEKSTFCSVRVEQLSTCSSVLRMLLVVPLALAPACVWREGDRGCQNVVVLMRCSYHPGTLELLHTILRASTGPKSAVTPMAWE